MAQAMPIAFHNFPLLPDEIKLMILRHAIKEALPRGYKLDRYVPADKTALPPVMHLTTPHSTKVGPWMSRKGPTIVRFIWQDRNLLSFFNTSTLFSEVAFNFIRDLFRAQNSGPSPSWNHGWRKCFHPSLRAARQPSSLKYWGHMNPAILETFAHKCGYVGS